MKLFLTIITPLILSPNGANWFDHIQWGTAYDGSGYNDAANALAVDSTNIYIVGYTKTGTYKDALIIKYNSIGTRKWLHTYDGSAYDDVFTDITVGGTCIAGASATLYPGGYTEKSSTDYDYLLDAYVSTTGAVLNHYPVKYDDNASSPEATGTDQGYAVEYVESDVNSYTVYITGRSDTSISGTKTIDITTVGYDPCGGSKVWRDSYEYSVDNPILGTDEMHWKYGLFAVYDDYYCAAQLYVEGESYVSGHGFDFITLKYGGGGSPCGKKIPNPNYKPVTGLYPNPFSTDAVLSISQEISVNNASLIIYDITGQIVKKQNNINTNNIDINRGNLKQGVYYYILTTEEEILSNGKFLIME